MGVTSNYLLLIVNCEQEVRVEKNTSKNLKQNCGQKMWWKKKSAAMPNTCKNKLWLEAHSYKWRISIVEVVASELLFGLAVNWLEIQLFWLKKYPRLQYSKFWVILK